MSAFSSVIQSVRQSVSQLSWSAACAAIFDAQALALLSLSMCPVVPLTVSERDVSSESPLLVADGQSVDVLRDHQLERVDGRRLLVHRQTASANRKKVEEKSGRKKTNA